MPLVARCSSIWRCRHAVAGLADFHAASMMTCMQHPMCNAHLESPASALDAPVMLMQHSTAGPCMHCSFAVSRPSAAYMPAFNKDQHSALQSRGAPLRGIHATPTLSAHEARLRQGHWQHAQATDMGTVYAKHLDPLDKRRYVVAAADSTQSIDSSCLEELRLLALRTDRCILSCGALKKMNAVCLQD